MATDKTKYLVRDLWKSLVHACVLFVGFVIFCAMIGIGIGLGYSVFKLVCELFLN